MVPSDRNRGNRHKLIPGGSQEITFEHQETLSYCEGDRALVQVAKVGCGVSILGDTQKPSRHGPAESAVGEVDHMTSIGPFKPQAFCDSVSN